MLISLDDLQTALNIDLTDPEGQETATNLISAAVAWIEKVVGYKLEESEQTAYFEDGYCQMWLPTGAPVSQLEVSSFNTITGTYDAVDPSYVRFADTGEVDVRAVLPSGFHAVKAAFTAGWTAVTLPKDLRQALIEMVGIKLLEIANLSSATTTTDEDGNEISTTPVGALKRVQSDSYTEEYSTAETDAYWKAKSAQLSQSIGDGVAAGIMATINRYKRPFAL